VHLLVAVEACHSSCFLIAVMTDFAEPPNITLGWIMMPKSGMSASPATVLSSSCLSPSSSADHAVANAEVASDLTCRLGLANPALILCSAAASRAKPGKSGTSYTVFGGSADARIAPRRPITSRHLILFTRFSLCYSSSSESSSLTEKYQVPSPWESIMRKRFTLPLR
jgi:hypothetical protein